MATRAISAVLSRAARTAGGDANAGPDADADLVRRFADTADPAAFRRLVDRHGPMVLGVCRRVTGHPQDAEDAFQAAFLVLATKAAGVHDPANVGGWLHGVATRTAARARAAAARRRTRETELPDVPARDSEADPSSADLSAELDAALAGLPEKYRVAVVLCELEGRSLGEVAAALGVPPGTVASRLARGRDRLAARLRKYAPEAVGAALTAAVAVPPALAAAATGVPDGVTSETVSELSRGVIRDMFLTKLRTAAVTAVAVLTVCGAAAVALSADAPPPPAPPVKRAPLPEFAGKPADAGKQVADANTAFGLDLYGKLIADKDNAGKNVFFSPLSIEAALAMTAAGADGNTFAEMQAALRLPKDESATDAGFKHVFAKINDADTPAAKRGYTLSLANAIYAQKGYPWETTFTDRVAAAYGGGHREADFHKDLSTERQRINDWVAAETRDRIKNILGPRDLNPATRMVLVNAIYFKGDWETAFKKDQTKDKPFVRTDGTKVTAPLMYQSGAYPLYQDDTLQALELPYKAGQTAMVVLLPRSADGLPALEKQITPENLTKWTTALAANAALQFGRRGEKVDVFLPKFRTETAYDLNSTLQALGMRDAFEVGKADFLRMSPKAKSDSLHVAFVKHKAFVEVNEEGTEAAAATVAALAGGGLPPPKPVFRADHPFVFAIVHKPTNAILFLGRVEDPTAK